MYICLDCGTELQIIKQDDHFQLIEVREGNGYPIGKAQKEFAPLVGEILHCALSEYEVLTLQEMQDVIRSTMGRIEDYFAQHSDYLAQL